MIEQIADMSPAILYPILIAIVGAVFGAGKVVEKLQNGKYVANSTCQAYQKGRDSQWQLLKEDVEYIRRKLDLLLERKINEV